MSTSQFPTEPGQFGPEEHSSQQQGTEYPQFPQPLILPPPPKKRSRRNLWITLAVFVVLLTSVRAISQSVTHTNPETQSTAAAVCIHLTATDVLFQQTAVAVSHVWMTTVAASTPAPTQVPVTPVQTFATITDGTFQVSSDIQPGTYRTQTDAPRIFAQCWRVSLPVGPSV